MIKVTTTWTNNNNPNTIWNRLAAKLGREPTPAEAAAEVKRLLREAVERRIMSKQQQARSTIK